MFLASYKDIEEKFITNIDPKEDDDIGKTLCSYEYEFVAMEGIKITRPNKGKGEYTIFIPLNKKELSKIEKDRKLIDKFFRDIDHYKIWHERKFGIFYHTNLARSVMILCLNMYKLIKTKGSISPSLKRTIKMEK